jgi:hypothetical protein
MLFFMPQYKRNFLLFSAMKQKKFEAADKLLLPFALLGNMLAQQNEMAAQYILMAIAQQIGKG